MSLLAPIMFAVADLALWDVRVGCGPQLLAHLLGREEKVLKHYWYVLRRPHTRELDHVPCTSFLMRSSDSCRHVSRRTARFPWWLPFGDYVIVSRTKRRCSSIIGTS